jgi:hypothetical protein
LNIPFFERAIAVMHLGNMKTNVKGGRGRGGTIGNIHHPHGGRDRAEGGEKRE